MKVTPTENDFPICACGRRSTDKLGSSWVCAECVAIDALELGRVTHCGFPEPRSERVQKDWEDPWQMNPEPPIAGGSLEYLKAMLA